MALPSFASKMIIKPMTSMALQAYRQGRDDFEKGEYDEDSFEHQIKKLIKKQF